MYEEQIPNTFRFRKSVVLYSNPWNRMEILCEILKTVKALKFRKDYVPNSPTLLCK